VLFHHVKHAILGGGKKSPTVGMCTTGMNGRENSMAESTTQGGVGGGDHHGWEVKGKCNKKGALGEKKNSMSNLRGQRGPRCHF